jgi:hypothetical protein
MTQDVIKVREGTFGDYSLDGIWYEDQEGNRAWRVALVSQWANHRYWVSENEFRSVQVNTSAETRGTSIVIGEVLVDVDPVVRQGVLDKIRTWEKEEADALPADGMF